MRQIRVLILFLAVLGTAGTCASTAEEELNKNPRQLTDSVDGALSDSATLPFYIVTRRDLRRCAYPMCGGYFVQRVNRNTTVCANGMTQKECRIIEFDYTALKLDPASRDRLTSYADSGRALLRGTITKTMPLGGHTYDKLVVSEAYTPLSADPPGHGSLGELCGSRGLPGECADGLFCKRLPEANCGRGDAPGTCTAKPEVCLKLYDPVCGCDGTTYGNPCEAWTAGTSVDHAGPCP